MSTPARWTTLADVDGDDPAGNNVNDDDPNTETLPQNPDIMIVKMFADDFVIAGGAGSSFTLVVTNEGNVTLSSLAVTDTVDSRLGVTDVSVTTGGTCGDTDSNVQTIECSLSDLAPGESATITVTFAVAANVPEAIDPNQVQNSATVNGEGPQAQPVTDTATDDIEIKTLIDLTIVKAFVNDPVPQGTGQSFTLTVSNAGPSDAVDVSIDDIVDPLLEVVSVTVTSTTTGASVLCAPVGQVIDCTADIPVGGEVVITVEYLAAPFNTGDPQFGGTDGSEFTFVFLNGYKLEGYAAGDVKLYDETGLQVRLPTLHR